MVVGVYYRESPRERVTIYALRKKGLVREATHPHAFRWTLTDKGKQHVHTPYWYGPVVASSELSTLKMTSGNKKRYPEVIKDDVVQEWTGIGWIVTRQPTVGDRNKLPQVIDANW